MRAHRRKPPKRWFKTRPGKERKTLENNTRRAKHQPLKTYFNYWWIVRASFQQEDYWRKLMKMHYFGMQCKYNDIWGANVSFESNSVSMTVTMRQLVIPWQIWKSIKLQISLLWNVLGCQIALVVVEVVNNAYVKYHVGWKFTKHKISIHFLRHAPTRHQTNTRRHETRRNKRDNEHSIAEHIVYLLSCD